MTGQRSLVVDDEIRVRAYLRRGVGEHQVEDTPADPERLGVGELTESDVFEPFELCKTLDRAIQDARQRHPGMRVELPECVPTTIMGSTVGLMLIEVNAVASGVQCGQARTVTVAAHYDYGALDVVIDDGRGVPNELGASAFYRFVKVRTRAIPGGGWRWCVRRSKSISLHRNSNVARPTTSACRRGSPPHDDFGGHSRMSGFSNIISPTNVHRTRRTLDITAGEPSV